VSNRLAISPLSRGAATLDGLKRNGQSYSNSVREVFTSIDTLTSQPIDLSGLTAADAVYLSFAWQEGSVVGPTQRNTSTTPVRLELEFKTSASTWQAPADPQNPAAVWVKRGTGLPVRGFRQAIFPLTQAQYLHGGFQFRFRATGNSSLARDLWNIDYVVVDRNRSPSDTTFADIATSAGLRGSLRSGGLSSPLRRYTAMPVWQFNAAPAGSELNPNLGVNVSNLRPGMLPLPTVIVGTVRDLRSGTALGVWQQRSRPLPVTPRTDSLVGNAANVRIPNTPAAKRLRYTLVLNSQEQNARTLPNDTIFRDVDLANYYAFDDGTAEAIVSLPAASTGAPTYFAYRISPNRADMVQAVRRGLPRRDGERVGGSERASGGPADGYQVGRNPQHHASRAIRGNNLRPARTGQPAVLRGIRPALAGPPAALRHRPEQHLSFGHAVAQHRGSLGHYQLHSPRRPDDARGDEQQRGFIVGHGPRGRRLLPVPQSGPRHRDGSRAALCAGHGARCLGPHRVGATRCPSRAGSFAPRRPGPRRLRGAPSSARWWHRHPPPDSGMRTLLTS
jgi:hypothetical protein